MIKNLVRHGNSKAVVIEKAILELLKIEDDTPLEVITNGNALIIVPIHGDDKAGRKMSFDEALNRVNERHKETFARLAK